jgi:hypothetical protein
VERYAGREMARSGEPLVVNMARDTDVHLALAGEPRTR